MRRIPEGRAQQVVELAALMRNGRLGCLDKIFDEFLLVGGIGNLLRGDKVLRLDHPPTRARDRNRVRRQPVWRPNIG